MVTFIQFYNPFSVFKAPPDSRTAVWNLQTRFIVPLCSSSFLQPNILNSGPFGHSCPMNTTFVQISLDGSWVCSEVATSELMVQLVIFWCRREESMTCLLSATKFPSTACNVGSFFASSKELEHMSWHCHLLWKPWGGHADAVQLCCVLLLSSVLTCCLTWDLKPSSKVSGGWFCCSSARFWFSYMNLMIISTIWCIGLSYTGHCNAVD